MPEETSSSGVVNAMGRWVGRALDIVYPRNCQFCSVPLAEIEQGVICASCLSQARRIKAPFCFRCALPFDGKIEGEFVCSHCHDLKFHFTRAVAACRSTDIVRDSIHRFKYYREMYYGPHLADWLVEVGRQEIDWTAVDALVPVPLHPRKKREREFNQAEYLAAAVGKEFNVRVEKGNLVRVKYTVTQTALSAESRRSNLRDAFAVKRPAHFAGKRLVVLDDVFTTGATMNECARALAQAGAVSVTAMAVARGV